MTKVSKSVLRAVTVLSVLLALACQAKASPIVFDIVNGQLDDGASVTGTITINTTTGIATSADVSVGSPDNQVFTSANITTLETLNNYRDPYTNTYVDTLIYIHQGTLGNPYPDLGLLLPETSLIGVTTQIPLVVGAIQGASTFEISGYPYVPEVFFSSGSLTPTPEPTTITMLVSGFFAAGGFGLYRRRRGRASGEVDPK